MQCSCGSSTKSNSAKSGALKLQWVECITCGRVGDFCLYQGSTLLQKGEQARQAFFSKEKRK